MDKPPEPDPRYWFDDLDIYTYLATVEKPDNVLLAPNWAITRVFKGEEDLSYVLRGFNLEKKYNIALHL